MIDIHHLLFTAKFSISIESKTNYAPKTLGSCTCEDRYPFNNMIMTTTTYNLYIFSNHSANLQLATKPLLLPGAIGCQWWARQFAGNLLFEKHNVSLSWCMWCVFSNININIIITDSIHSHFLNLHPKQVPSCFDH